MIGVRRVSRVTALAVASLLSCRAQTETGTPPAEPSSLLPSASKAGGILLVAADRVLDGRGQLLERVSIAVHDGKIEAVGVAGESAIEGEHSGVRRYNLSGLTLMPGLIDTHVHIDWYFDRSGRTRSAESQDTPAQQMLFAVENAYQTLLGGVTTVQSLGGSNDVDLRDWIERGVVPGPRILTSIESISQQSGSPAEIRQQVEDLDRRGADVIKIFGSASIRVGGTPTMTQAQLDAACGTATRLGLRAAVHAHGPESARRSVLAGCTTIEHGALLDRATLQLMAERGVYYDPNIDLILRNYFENKERFLGVGNYTEEGFAQMEAAVPKALEVFKVALEIPDLKIVFGTDALAGSHGRNVEELVYRIEKGGQSPSQAIVSATSLAAESIGLQDRIGSIAEGYQADLIAVEGNPLEDPSALSRVAFVMKGGVVYRNQPPTSPK